ncbi:MAG: DUF2336 domain-containing protein [Kiloniellales bacterium]
MAETVTAESKPVQGVNLQDLIELARDKSQKGRAALVSAMTDLYEQQAHCLTETDRAMMVDILHQLVHEVEVSVRHALAEYFAERRDAPQQLVVMLANDEIDVAYPILVKSEVLRDEQLIEVIQFRTMEHQLAIAMRDYVSEPVSQALVDTDNEQVVVTLLRNRGAAIASGTMEQLVDKSRQVPDYRALLVHREELPAALAKKLYWGVSAALRKHIVEHFEIDPAELDEAIETTVKSVLVKDAGLPPPPPPMAEPPKPGNIEALLAALRCGDIAQFLEGFRKLSRLRMTLVRRILFEPGGEGLAIVCRASGLDKSAFVTILLYFRQGRLGDKQVEVDELARAVRFYDEIAPQAAQAFLARLRRDPDYLNALRLIEQTGG